MSRILSDQQKEENRKRAKLYYQNNKERLKEYAKKRHQEFKETINKKLREFRANDPNKKEKQRRAIELPRKRWTQAKRAASYRSKVFTITYEQFIKLIDNPCYYCNNKLGEKSKTGSGLDRVNNDLGYEIDNVVSCCVFCNKLKSNILNEIEMVAVVNLLISLRNKNGTSE